MPTNHSFVETKYYQRIKTDHALTFRIFLGGHTTNLDRRHVPPIHRPTAFFSWKQKYSRLHCSHLHKRNGAVFAITLCILLSLPISLQVTRIRDTHSG